MNLLLGPCIRSEVNVDDNELILALHDLLAEMAELAAEERGAFLEEEKL